MNDKLPDHLPRTTDWHAPESAPVPIVGGSEGSSPPHSGIADPPVSAQHPVSQHPVPAHPVPAQSTTPQQPWASPRSAGLLPLRPMDFGAILGTPYRALRRNPRVNFGASLLITGATTLLSGAVIWLVGSAVFGGLDFTSIMNGEDDLSAADSQRFTSGLALVMLSLVIPSLVASFTTIIMQGLLSLEISRQLVDEKLRFGQLWARARGRVGALVGAGALLQAAGVLFTIFVGVILLVTITFGVSNGNNFTLAIVFGVLVALGTPVILVWLLVRLAFVPSVITIERLGVFAALRRSWLLSRGAFWKTFGTLALVSVILNFASSIAVTPVQLAAGLFGNTFSPTGDPAALIPSLVVSAVAVAVVSTVIGAISLVIISATTSLLYIDRRMRTEGLDHDLTEYVEARHSGFQPAEAGIVGGNGNGTGTGTGNGNGNGTGNGNGNGNGRGVAAVVDPYLPRTSSRL